MKKARKKSLEKKLAVAISVVNLLNAAAPVALPYVNLTQRADGVAPGALIRVAEANEYYYDYVDYVLDVHGGDTTTIGQLADGWVNVGGKNIIKKVTGGYQILGGDGVGQIDLMLNGGQILSYGSGGKAKGSHGNITLISGGYQRIEHNASGTIETMEGGKQYVSGGYAANGQDYDSKGIGSVGTMNGGTQYVTYEGGTAIARVMNGGTQIGDGYHLCVISVGTMNDGTQNNYGDTAIIDVMNGGTQIVGAMDTTKWHKGQIGTMKGGTQLVGWGDGSIDVLSGGTQYLESLPYQATVSVGTMYGGKQIVRNYQDNDPRSGGGVISTMNGGEQDLGSSTWGRITAMHGGTQIVGDDANGDIADMDGGTQIVSSGGTGRISSFHGGTQIVSGGGQLENIDVRSGALLEEHPGAKFINVFFSGGTHRIVGLEKNDYSADNRTLEVGSGAKTSGTQVKNGSMEVVLEGGSSTDAVIASGGAQIVSGGSASLADLNSGATQTVAGGSGSVTNIKSGGMQVVSGGTASATTLEYGGTQLVSGGSASVETLKIGSTQTIIGGTGSTPMVSGTKAIDPYHNTYTMQRVSGGTGIITRSLEGDGIQEVYSGFGSAAAVSGGGAQIVAGGSAVVDIMGAGGRQVIIGGSGRIQTMNNGEQIVSVAHVSVTVHDGGIGTIDNLKAGTQKIYSGGTGSVGTLAGGRIEMYSGGSYKGNITGHGTLWNVNMGGTVTASGGNILGSNLSVGTLSVADGGSVSIYTDRNNPSVVGNIKANTISLGTAPTNANPLITATGDITVGAVDFTGLKVENAGAEYTFISAGGALSDLTVKRNDFTATLASGGRIEGQKSRETTVPTNVLTLGYDVANTLSHTGKTLTYKFDTTGYTDATFDGAIAWASGGTYFDATGYSFVSNPAVNLSNLAFSFTQDQAKALAKGQSMTLLSGVSGATISAAAPTSFALSQAGNNTVLSATANGSASSSNNAVKYTVNSVTLDSVKVTDITGTADEVPTGWAANTAGVRVDAGSFTTPMSVVGEKKTLLTADSDSAIFSDANITGDNKYAAGKTFSDADKGVTISGTWSHGVYASADGKSLVFDAGDVKANKIELGAMTWGTPRALTGEYDCDFSGVTTMDASGLSFTGLNASVEAEKTYDLLTEANNLAAGKAVTGKDHTQSFGASADNGAKLSATLSGVVSTAENSVRYTANSITLDGVDLSGWNGEKAAVPATWTANAKGVAVTGNFTEPTGLVPGTFRNILTTDTKNYFSGAQIDDAIAFKAHSFNDEDAGVAFAGTQSKGVAVGGEQLNHLVYKTTEKNVADISLGAVSWDAGRTVETKDGYDFLYAKADAGGLRFTFTDDQKAALSSQSKTTLLSGATNLAADTTTVINADHQQSVGYLAANGAALVGTLTGKVSAADKQLVYQATGMTLDGVDLRAWNPASDTVPDVPAGWMKGSSAVTVNTDVLTLRPEDLAGKVTTILTATNGALVGANITGENAYGKQTDFSSEKNGVTLSGSWARGVRLNEANDLVFDASTVYVNNISLGEISWENGGSLRPNANIDAINYEGVNDIDTSSFSIANPMGIAAKESMTLLTANTTLKDMAKEVNIAYSDTPATGVNLAGVISGNLQSQSGLVTYTATANQASKLTFGDVQWTGESPLTTRPQNVSFDGTAVDTTNIRFTNISSLDEGAQTRLVSDFGTSIGDVTGTRYKAGTTLAGEGSAELKGSDLVFTVKTVEASEETHSTLMGAGAGMATLSVGNEFIGAAAEGLADAANIGADGVSTYAQMGGGSIRQETGSHIDIRAWNAILALGHKNEKEKSAFEYGAFFEYGTGNYTTHNGDLRGDGSVRYTGGGLLAKWTAKHGLYVEGSLRAGTVHGETRNVMLDPAGNPHNYETDAPYWGAHIGVGREIALANGDSVDVYGKYFFNRRNSISFDADTHYDLDALTSQVLRVGARYTMKREKWNFYGGLSYEHEFDGKASGSVSNGVGNVPIRGTDTSGGSFRAEIGAKVTPENTPWSLDLNLSGFAGKKQGVMGGISISWLF